MQDESDGERGAEAPSYRAELRRLVTGVNLVVLTVSIGLGVWGALDSMVDADGERFWGNLAIGAPGLYAGWCMLEPAWRRGVDLLSLMMRIVSACLIAPLLVAIPVGILLAIAVAFPGVRDVIASATAENRGFHYYWSEGIGTQLALVPLGGWIIGACIALGACLVLTLPILSLRAPSVLAAGSHLQKVAGAKRDSTTALLFCGLGVLVLGICLWIFGDGDGIADFPSALWREVQYALRYGEVYWREATWLIGVVLVVVGLVLAGAACVRVLWARGRAGGPHEAEPPA